MDFECVRCGKCCSNIRGPMFGQVHGLTIMPKERHLFPAERVKPMLRYKERSKFRPSEIFMYQVDVEDCPHHADGCQIYEDRPQICRAFPFELKGDGGVALHGSCPEIERLAKAETNFYMPVFYQKAAIVIQRHYQNTLHRTPLVERFDLKTRRWRGLLEGMTNEHLKLMDV